MNLSLAVRTVVDTPSMAAMKLNSLYGRWTMSKSHPEGMDVFAQDWDNLLILDACRADELERMIDLPGTFETRTSKATTTRQFIRTNFEDKTLHDTVYVTSNGWVAALYDSIGVELHKVLSLDGSIHSQSDSAVVPPEQVTEEARSAAKEYPDKRLIVHYTQPHKPYLGEFGRATFGSTQRNLQQIMSAESRSEEDLKRAYRENLSLVLDEVEELVDALDGKTVITADHGELLGERVSPIPIRGYGHPPYVYHRALSEVPWFVCDFDERREITSERPRGLVEVDRNQINEQLRDLGYVT